ncbi:ATPase domain-containing protein [Natronoarchaeum mannanilyticum]
MSGTDDSDPDRCDFCRLPCPEGTHTLERDGTTYRFCSATCRDAMQRSDRVFTEYHGHRRIDAGVAGLDAALPQGLPRNSFVLVGGQTGSRSGALQAELVWRALDRGDPAVIVSFGEPPASVVQRFLTLDWNVLPHLESGRLRIVDCFTYRLEDRDRYEDRLCEWNVHLSRFTDDAVTSVRDPSDASEIRHKLDAALDDRDMIDRGVVSIDSLTEFGTLVQPVQAYDFVKDLRADVCKGRFVPVFAGATLQGGGESFPHDLHYIADGIVDLQMNDELVEDTLIKRARVRKMSGVLSYQEWVAYEYTAGEGMVTFSPAEEIEGEDSASGAGTDAMDAEDADPTAENVDDAVADAPDAGDGDDAESLDAGASATADDSSNAG